MNEHVLPKVIVASVPKGGTNLLMQIILGIPGMAQTRQNMLARGHAGLLTAGEMGVMHLPYSLEVDEVLQSNRIKVIFISRDLRDIVVSMSHFIASSFPSHVLYPAFMSSLTSNEARLSAIINGLDFHRDLSDTVLANELFVAHGSSRYPNIHEFCAPFLAWTKSGTACHVTFEELANSSAKRTAALRRIVDFLWADLSGLGIPKGMMVSQMEQNINPGLSPTFRSGRIGDWKFEFQAQHKEDMKRLAGEALIELGYEKDKTW